MKKLEKYKKKSKESKVKESATTYGKSLDNTLLFFNSFDEMNNYDLKEMGQSTASERFQHITFLLQNLYNTELKSKGIQRDLHFQ